MSVLFWIIASTGVITLFALAGALTLVLKEKLFHWRHCHQGHCQVHSFGYINLFGDAIHNFIDGLIIAAAFSANIHLGLVTAFATAMHEVPQEIGGFVALKGR